MLRRKILDTQELNPFNISPNMYTEKVQNMWTNCFIRLIYGVPDIRHGIYDSVCKCTFCIYKQDQSKWNYIIMMKCNWLYNVCSNLVCVCKSRNYVLLTHTKVWCSVYIYIYIYIYIYMLHGSKTDSWFPESISPFCWFSRGFCLHFPKRQMILSASSRRQYRPGVGVTIFLIFHQNTC